MRNPVAKDLRTPKYKMRVVASKKGRGSFKRKEKHVKGMGE
jgi:alternative ribosome-rescue factor